MQDTRITDACDGERWRWLLENAAELDPGRISHIKYTLAIFLHGQFGVQTLSAYSHFFARFLSQPDKDSLTEALSPYEVHALGKTIWEIPAGTIDPPEAPLECAKKRTDRGKRLSG